MELAWDAFQNQTFRQEKHKPISLAVFVLRLEAVSQFIHQEEEMSVALSGCSAAGSTAAGTSAPCVQVPPKPHPCGWNPALLRTRTVLGVRAVFRDSYKIPGVAVKYL